ncbi:unnamed protein product [Tilletia controversa]|nr:unnamed protein product [Tilletia controversa]
MGAVMQQIPPAAAVDASSSSSLIAVKREDDPGGMHAGPGPHHQPTNRVRNGQANANGHANGNHAAGAAAAAPRPPPRPLRQAPTAIESILQEYVEIFRVFRAGDHPFLEKMVLAMKELAQGLPRSVGAAAAAGSAGQKGGVVFAGLPARAQQKQVSVPGQSGQFFISSGPSVSPVAAQTQAHAASTSTAGMQRAAVYTPGSHSGGGGGGTPSYGSGSGSGSGSRSGDSGVATVGSGGVLSPTPANVSPGPGPGPYGLMMPPPSVGGGFHHHHPHQQGQGQVLLTVYLSMSSAPYKGALRSKRKAELTEIAASLSIPLDAEAKKDDIEHLIRAHLLDVKTQAVLRNNATYSGLYDSMEYGRASRSSVVDSDASESGSPERQLGRSPRKHGARGSSRLNGVGSPSASASAHAARLDAEAAVEHAGTAAREAGNALSTLVRRTSARARSSIEDLASRFRSGAVAAGHEVADEVAEARAEASSATRAVSRRVSAGVTKVQNDAVSAYENAREWASDAEHVAQIVVGLELLILLVNATPIRTVLVGQPTSAVHAAAEAAKHTLKAAGHKVLQHETQAQVHTALSKFWAFLPKLYAFVPFPAIFSRTFLHPFALWAGLTVLLPWVASHLITFEHRKRATRAHGARAPASVLVFNIVRLVMLLYLAHLVPSDPAVSWFSHQASSLTGHHPAAAGHVPIPPAVVGVAAGRTGVPLTATSSSSWTPVVNALSYVHHGADVVGDVLAYGRHVNGVLGADVQILGTLLSFGVALAEQVAH